MNLRDLQETDEGCSIFRSAQICVIGAGIAGLAIATSLAKAGKHVLIIESGPEQSLSVPNYSSTSDLNPALQDWPRGLGGASVQWGGRLLPLTAHELGKRPYLSLEGWPLSPHDLNIHLPEIERMFRLDDSSYEEDMLEHLSGANLLPRRDPDFICRLPKWPTFRNRNVYSLLRAQIEKLANLEIWTNAAASEFQLDEGRGRVVAVGARAPGERELRVQADEFVLAAGTIETTRLLLLLDRCSSHRAFAGCAALGRYFQEHLKTDIGELTPISAKAANQLFGYRVKKATHRSLYFQLTPEVQEAKCVGSAFLTVRFELPQDSPLDRIKNIARGHQRGGASHWRKAVGAAADPSFLAGIAYWRWRYKQIFLPRGTRFVPEIRIEQLPNWSNRIALSEETDGMGTPKAKIEWEPTAYDERTFRVCVERMGSYWSRTGLIRTCPIRWDENVRGPSISLASHAEKTWHPSGSTRMGTNPADSVVDPKLRCHSIPNVRVVSASTFPTAGSGNPTLTILQLAFRTSASMLSQS